MISKKIKITEIFSLIFVILVTILVLTIPRPQYSHSLNIIAFGDSLTQGFGAPSGKNYVDYLSNYIETPITNAGIFGDTTADALVRLQKDILDKNPDIVIVLLGGNDLIKNYPLEVTQANLEKIIEEIKNIHAKVILVGLNQQQMPSFELMLQHLAVKGKVDGYIPNAAMGVLFTKNYTSTDQLHPNEKGYELIAKKILPTLKNVILKTNK